MIPLDPLRFLEVKIEKKKKKKNDTSPWARKRRRGLTADGKSRYS